MRALATTIIAIHGNADYARSRPTAENRTRRHLSSQNPRDVDVSLTIILSSRCCQIETLGNKPVCAAVN